MILRFLQGLYGPLQQFLFLLHRSRLFPDLVAVSAAPQEVKKRGYFGGKLLDRFVDQRMRVFAVLAETADGTDEVLEHRIVRFPEPQRDGNVSLGQLIDRPAYPDNGPREGMGVNGADDPDEYEKGDQGDRKKNGELKYLRELLKHAEEKRVGHQHENKKNDESGLRTGRVQIALFTAENGSLCGFGHNVAVHLPRFGSDGLNSGVSIPPRRPWRMRADTIVLHLKNRTFPACFAAGNIDAKIILVKEYEVKVIFCLEVARGQIGRAHV